MFEPSTCLDDLDELDASAALAFAVDQRAPGSMQKQNAVRSTGM